MGLFDENGDTRVFTDHNVYILGAGFSADAGVPLLDDFLYQTRASLNWLRKEARNEERSEIAKVLKFRKEAASAALRVTLNIENIEDLFSLAAASKKYPLEQTVSTAIAATIDFSRRNSKPECFEANVKHNFKRPENWQQKTSGQLEGIYRIPVYDA